MATNTSVGSINEEGFIKNLFRKGFNMNRALSEIIQNCIDAGCSKIECIKILNKIIITDDGKGMNDEELSYMWDAYRENHSNEISGGVSGLGSKPSTLIMSQTSLVIVYTKSQKGNYIKAIVPWEEIFRDKVYTNKIKVINMNDDEIKMFKCHQTNTGTILEFNYSHKLFDCLKLQFYDSKKIDDITQRSDWIFSEFPQTITFINKDNNESQELLKYKYFSAHINDYYNLNNKTIEVFKMNNDNIVYAIKLSENRYIHQIENKRGFQMDEFIEYRTCIKIGTIIIKCGLRKDIKYFDCNKPIIPGASKVLLEYDSKFFSNGVAGENSGDEIKASLWYPHITRNGQNIGIIKSLPKMNFASARASGKSCLSNNHIRTSVMYNVNSSQTNNMDELFGIQENKNQLNSHSIDIKFLRTIEHIMKETADNIWDNFQDYVNKEVTRKELERKEKIKQVKLEKERQEKLEKERQEKLEKERQEKKEREEQIKIEEVILSDKESDSESDEDDESDESDTEQETQEDYYDAMETTEKNKKEKELYKQIILKHYQEIDKSPLEDFQKIKESFYKKNIP